MVPIDLLKLEGSPRLSPHDAGHVQVMALLGEEVPPIIVHRPTMRVVDGVHRILASRLCGRDSIAARFFDGSDADAFLLSVKANVTHGLPLSLADRETAAIRIMQSHRSWSNRAIAEAAGLSAKKVAAIRECSTDEADHLNMRIGRDGRVRPLNAAVGRIRASEVIRERPDASIREIAREAGISVGTAHDVRERLLKGLDPVPANQHSGSRKTHPAPGPAPRRINPSAADAWVEMLDGYQRMRRDPSLRYTEQGRSLIRRLDMCVFDESGWRDLVDAVPPHQATDVANLARSLAEQWQRAANELSSRSDRTA
ncbi:streptomycin biosynthesis protein [Streptomyces diastaticus]|uniref:streptomycin biosynthesis protein n=1 Tax=Streptomyces diastaticus TaxID=1956 RepID=UPI0033F98CC8